MRKPLPTADLDHVLLHAGQTFRTLSGAHIFITGGTGFFGRWLLESLLHANQRLGIGARATVLTRNVDRFRENCPHIANDPAISLVEGDVATFALDGASFTHILHAATDSAGSQAAVTEQELATSIMEGTRRVLRLAESSGAARLLYVSSGAVYGRNLSDVLRISESYPLPPPVVPPQNYDQAKRLSSDLCLATGQRTGMAVSIANCFAFVGPLLPLDMHFAVGNFIGDALAARPIHIRGDGTPLRSFLYMADLAVWLWTILASAPAASTYNVGSDEAVSIAELAHITADTLCPGLAIQVDGVPDPSRAPTSYVPDITRAREELGLAVRIPLPEAILRTAAWHRS